ncbi:MAG: hypothetical protein V4650_06905 [Pseudomonadota bacterium]
MPDSAPQVRFAVLPALMFAVGLGLAFYYGDAWYGLPRYTEAEIEQSVELNLALALRANPASTSTDETSRAAIRSELLAEINQEQRDAQRGLVIGVVLCAFGLLQMLMLRRMARRQLPRLH